MILQTTSRDYKKIKNELVVNGYYKFASFFAYHDTLYNKQLYGKVSPNTPVEIQSITIPNDQSIYKISMSSQPNEISEDQYQYGLENKYIYIGETTKALATMKISQALLFTDKMKIGDYFYLCRGNKYIELLGRITGNAEKCNMPGIKRNDWLQRSFEVVMFAKNKSPYKGKQKWWAPNHNSTCVEIPEKEIETANENIFIPFFNSKIIFTTINNTPLNTILFGPPGTGKTYQTVSKAVSIANPDFDLSQSRDKVKDEYDRLVTLGRIKFTTFHQSMCYEDFVEGIKPKMQHDTNDLQYEIKSGIFKSICDTATGGKETSFDNSYEKFIEELTLKGQIKMVTPSDKKAFLVKKNSVGNCSVIPNTEKASEMTITKSTIHKIFKDPNETMWRSYSKPIADYIKEKYYNINVDASKSNFVLIIDEINRGNVASIFGELITLIEKDKRAGMDEALEVVLPYSKEKFSVPQNLYIIGTMNTADRSIEALDTALRRRFSFVEMPPRYDLDDLQYNFEDYKASEILATINRRIEKLLDRDHLIGHSYFLLKHGDDIRNKLLNTFYNNIIPLLQEYFYGDYAKIGAVLGKGFIFNEESKSFDFAIGFDFDDFIEKDFYQIIDYREKQFGNQFIQSKMSFEKAIQLLMNKQRPE